MEELMILKLKIWQKTANELKSYSQELRIDGPDWYVHVRLAKYEFMNQVFWELPNFLFTVEESRAILKSDGFLEKCWKCWNYMEKSIPESMEYAAESLVLE